jgi:XTP/dITP diphosphohydrolase
LVVASLGGMPGIYSARYAGENASDGENINYLLEQLGTETAREAYFYCAIVVVNHTEDPTPLVAFGSWSGVIAPSPSGMDGFGYDPIFYIPSEQCTAAQLPATIKNSISHRAKALKQLQQLLIGNS